MDSCVESQFQRFLQNRFSALADSLPEHCEWWDELKDLIKVAGEEVLSFKRMLKDAWISDETWKFVTEQKELYQKRQNVTDVQSQSALYQEYKDKDKQVKHSAQKDKHA